MSKQLFAIPLLLLSLLLGACSDEEEGRINIDDSAPAQGKAADSAYGFPAARDM